MRVPRLIVLAVVALATVVMLLPSVFAAERKREKAHERRACPRQRPQNFLIRSNFVKHGVLDAAAHERAVRYRAEQYGNIVGLGLERYNAKKAYDSAVVVHFMGLPVQVHKKIAPALRCVEHYLRRACTAPSERYTPRAVGGFRQNNTYRGGEISNHLFGIAIDIDPERNP
ncbi:MAG: hypothetical protein ABJB12_15555, partial [Pseudomonadota bacterium]